MRYALRNRHKLYEAYGDEALKRITESLNAHFKEHAIIQFEVLADDKYPTMSIDDKGHTCGLILFYVIKTNFDVINLAFREFIN